MAAYAGLLEPIVGAMIRLLLGSMMPGTDETQVTVQDHAGKGSKADQPRVSLGPRENSSAAYDYITDPNRDGPERDLQTPKQPRCGLSPNSPRESPDN